MKVAQFGPILLAAWQKAITEGFSSDCGRGEQGRKKAVHLRYRMYRLRTAMQKESHPLAATALRHKLQIQLLNGTYYVKSATPDSDLEQVLVNAGVEIPEAPELPTEE